jgi:hypothetical protein
MFDGLAWQPDSRKMTTMPASEETVSGHSSYTKTHILAAEDNVT